MSMIVNRCTNVVSSIYYVHASCFVVGINVSFRGL